MEQISTARLHLRDTFQTKTLWTCGTLTLVISAFALLSSITVADADLWGHVRFGLDTLRAGTVIQVDPYSYLTTGQRWINHEWLAEVVFALAWTAAGAAGLIILKMTVGFLTTGLLYWHLLSLQLRLVRATILLLLLGSPLLFLFSSLVRPQIFTFLFFTLMLLIIRRADLGEYRWLWAAPLLLAFWANLHGGVLAGLGILCLWATLHLLFHRQAWRQFIPPTLAGVAATLANPYGLDLLTFLLRTATVPRPEINDWQPLKLVSIFGLMYLLVLIVSFAGLALSRQPRRPVLLIIFGITALLPWMAIRHLPLFCIASLVLTGEHVGSAWNRALPQKQRDLRLSPWAASLPVTVAAALLLRGSTLNLHRIHTPADDMPMAVVALLKQSGVSGNLAAPYRWGEYIIWHLGPQIKVSMDGRRETVYSTAIYQQNMNFMFGVKDWDALLSQHWTDMTLVEKNAPDDNLLRLKPGWLMVFEDAKSALFVNQDSSLVEPLRRAAANFTPPEANPYFP
jgi:hypothetical protein